MTRPHCDFKIYEAEISTCVQPTTRHSLVPAIGISAQISPAEKIPLKNDLECCQQNCSSIRQDETGSVAQSPVLLCPCFRDLQRLACCLALLLLVIRRTDLVLRFLPGTGVAGLYDYGPAGSALQANIIAEWRKHFIIEDSMLELDTTIMTPAPVFETSGHVARFADWMVKDTKTGDVLRADHLVKNVLEARLAGDKEARGEAAKPVEDDKKKKKKNVKKVAVRLEDELVKEYEVILAKVRCRPCTIRMSASSFTSVCIRIVRQLQWTRTWRTMQGTRHQES